jgi:uncharacterized membrane protein YccC
MATANPSLPLAESSTLPRPSSWRGHSRHIKQGIKTGLAGAITYGIYAGWNLPEGYWAVFTALVVTQTNLGASWKAALYRTIGSTTGAVAAALLTPIVGTGRLRAGIVLFLLAAFFGYLTALHPSFAAAGFTVAIILVFSSRDEPWHLAWYRVLYTLMGAFVAFAVGVLIWPIHAREDLRTKLASILEGCGALYGAVTDAAIKEVRKEEEIQQLSQKLHALRRGITEQMDEARSELAFSRFNQGAYQALVDLADQVRRRLTAMAEDSGLYVLAQVQPELVPSLPMLAQKTVATFGNLAEALRSQGRPRDSAELGAAVRNLETDLAKLREQSATAPFALDRMLPFWSFVFNLREIAQDLRQLQSSLAQLARSRRLVRQIGSVSQRLQKLCAR